MPLNKDEVVKILKLVEEGKINADEAARLIDALREEKHGAKFLRVRIYSENKNEPKVRVDIPWSVVKAFVRFGGSVQGIFPKDFKVNVGDKELNLHELDIAGLEQAVNEMATSEKLTIAEVWDEDKREKVEVYIE